MSNIRARFLNSKVTRWREGVSDDSNVYQKSWLTPISFRCNYKSGGAIQRDSKGADFSPASTYYMKLADINIGDRVSLGISSESSPIGTAETVRKIVTKTTLTGTADMTVYTG